MKTKHWVVGEKWVMGKQNSEEWECKTEIEGSQKRKSAKWGMKKLKTNRRGGVNTRVVNHVIH